MDTPPDLLRPDKAAGQIEKSRCRSGMCSTDFMKLGCPSCFLVGLVILPFELSFRGIKRLISGPNSDSLDLPG